MDSHLGQQPGVDEDGTSNTFDHLIAEAKKGTRMNQAITEPKSIEWLLEREAANLPEYLNTLKSQPRWTPRAGEIVLIARNLANDQRICYDESARLYKIYHPHAKFIGIPKWEAAVITQMPVTSNPHATVSLYAPDKDQDRFRVEPVSEPGNSNKAWSTRYTEIHYKNMRPFQFWQELLQADHVSDMQGLHPTVLNALISMCSFSLINRYWFTSNTQEARIYCSGVFIGPELIVEGDLVRFTSFQHEDSTTSDVMHIKNIYLSTRLDRDPEPQSLHVSGACYTTNSAHPFVQSERPIAAKDLPAAGMEGYGNWYSMHLDDKAMFRVPFNQIQSRLVEDNYVHSHFSDSSAFVRVAHGLGARNLNMADHILDMTYGAEGTDAGRQYSKTFDKRIVEGKTWLFAEDRAEQLDLHQINGQDVGEKARFGFGDTPEALQKSHLKAMFRARAARQKSTKGVFPSQKQTLHSDTLFARSMTTDRVLARDEALDDEEQRLDSSEEDMDNFEEAVGQSKRDYWEQFMEQGSSDEAQKPATRGQDG